MEHDILFGNSNRENGTTFLDFPLFLGIFQWDEPTKRVPFTAEPEIPEILTKWKAPFEFTVVQRNLARETMDACLRVLKESNKSRFDSYCVRNSVLIISHVTFRDCRVHIFSDNLSRNSCICTITDWRVNKTFKTSSINSCASLNTVPVQRLYIKRNIFRIKLL